MRVLYWDCPAGIAGDMALASLFDAGASPEAVESTLRQTGLDGFTFNVTRVTKQHLAATGVDTQVTAPQPHRRLADLENFLHRAPLTPRVRQQAHDIFTRLAEAEVHVHGIPVQEVHFHEVGAVDALVEVVGVCLALEALNIDRVVISALPMGRGFTTCAHGNLPLPAPATLELLRGFPIYGVDIDTELVTPTGAAIAAALADSTGPVPEMCPEAVGYGAGSRDLPYPNVLRAVIGQVGAETLSTARPSPAEAHDLVTLETNLDDLNPEVYPYVISRLLDEGAREAYLTPVIMKKGRPGVLLTVLALAEDARRLAVLVMQETGTLGLRMRHSARLTADRQFYAVQTRYGTVRVKVACFEGRVIQVKPEFEDCRARALDTGVPLREIQAEATAQARQELFRLFQDCPTISEDDQTSL